jgi:hypothetical protein
MGKCAFVGGIKNTCFLTDFVYLHIYSVCQSVDILYICIYTVYVRVLTFCISAYIQCMSECCLTHDCRQWLQWHTLNTNFQTNISDKEYKMVKMRAISSGGAPACTLHVYYCTMLTCTVLRKYSHWIQAWSIAILRNAVVLLSPSRHMGKGNIVWA